MLNYLTHLYDLESLKNVFTASVFMPEQNRLDVYLLLDTPEIYGEKKMLTVEHRKAIADRVRLRNKNFTGKVCVRELGGLHAVQSLAKEIGVSNLSRSMNMNVDKPDWRLRRPLFSDPQCVDSAKNAYRPVCDTDPGYSDEKYPYIIGYNSYNYDTAMLAYFFYKVLYRKQLPGERPVVEMTAAEMRDFNNLLFSEKYKDNMPKALEEVDGMNRSGSGAIRKNMLLSGRHLDVARLNEKARHLGLKRLLGTLGYQILESDKLSENCDTIHDFDELCELIAYNASDTINLLLLFEHPQYQAAFELKKQLLKTYPELVYCAKTDENAHSLYEPDVRPEAVRSDRLCIDSSSAQFATKCLCPYGHLSDLQTVSYMYPSERKAKELGVQQGNVLEETRKFFHASFEHQPELIAQFDRIYAFYKSLEGQNFDGSRNYRECDWRKGPPVRKLSDFGKLNGCIPYFNKDGTPSSCFALFSTGGLHGAEYNKALFDADMAEYNRKKAVLDYVQQQYPDPNDLRKAKRVTLQDGSVHKAAEFLKPKKMSENAEYRPLSKPELFSTDSKGNTALDGRYVYTSTDLTNHEDFMSYYPNMLRQMSAFYNPGLGYDRYAEIFENKQKYGKLMKDRSLPEEQRNFYRTLREGTKLILNSASGAGDTNFESPIQMNNRILSMRIIGQCFTWRIAQAQTLAGARITSTNTDGLYSVLEAELNNRILEKESKNIGVEIEPEPLYLISKDANNRMELDAKTGEITAASGGTVACRKGTTPAKALSHPAILDYALAEYLRMCADGKYGLSMDKPFDFTVGRRILNGAYDAFLKETGDEKKARQHWLVMFQNIISSSPAVYSYIFAFSKDGKPEVLQRYNRVFYMQPGYAGGVKLSVANAAKITPQSMRTRERSGLPKADHSDAVAMAVLKEYGIGEDVMAERDVKQHKLSNIGEDWNILIHNGALNELSDQEVTDIMQNICIDNYLDLLAKIYEGSWMNTVPEKPETDAISEKAEVNQISLF